MRQPLPITPERHKRAAGAVVVKNGHVHVRGAPIDRLLRRGMITAQQYKAGDRLRSDFYVGFAGAGGTELKERVQESVKKFSDTFMTVRRVDARARVIAALSAVGADVARILKRVVIEAESPDTMEALGYELFGRKQNKTAATAMIETLKLALSILHHHYHPPKLTRRDDAFALSASSDLLRVAMVRARWEE